MVKKSQPKKGAKIVARPPEQQRTRSDSLQQQMIQVQSFDLNMSHQRPQNSPGPTTQRSSTGTSQKLAAKSKQKVLSQGKTKKMTRIIKKKTKPALPPIPYKQDSRESRQSRHLPKCPSLDYQGYQSPRDVPFHAFHSINNYDGFTQSAALMRTSTNKSATLDPQLGKHLSTTQQGQFIKQGTQPSSNLINMRSQTSNQSPFTTPIPKGLPSVFNQHSVNNNQEYALNFNQQQQYGNTSNHKVQNMFSRDGRRLSSRGESGGNANSAQAAQTNLAAQHAYHRVSSLRGQRSGNGAAYHQGQGGSGEQGHNLPAFSKTSSLQPGLLTSLTPSDAQFFPQQHLPGAPPSPNATIPPFPSRELPHRSHQPTLLDKPAIFHPDRKRHTPLRRSEYAQHMGDGVGSERDEYEEHQLCGPDYRVQPMDWDTNQPPYTEGLGPVAEQCTDDPHRAAEASPAVFTIERREGRQGDASRMGVVNHVTCYLTALTTEQLVANTLTGFLITLIRKKGNVMSLADILAFAEGRFDTLRKPDGKAYTAKSKKKSIVCALSSNGIFNLVEQDAEREEKKDDLADERDGASELWQVNEEEAQKYHDEMVAKFNATRDRLSLRKRKYSGQDMAQQFQRQAAQNKLALDKIVEGGGAKMQSLKEVAETRRNRITAFEKFEGFNDMLERIVDQTHNEFDCSIDLPSATTQFNSFVKYKRSSSQPESEHDAAEREANRQQLEGFMLLYDMFRPLTIDYQDSMVREEQKANKLNLTTQQITSRLKSTEELGNNLMSQLREKGITH